VPRPGRCGPATPTPDLIALLKGLVTGVREAPGLAPDPELPARFLAILSDGLRPLGR